MSMAQATCKFVRRRRLGRFSPKRKIKIFRETNADKEGLSLRLYSKNWDLRLPGSEVFGMLLAYTGWREVNGHERAPG